MAAVNPLVAINVIGPHAMVVTGLVSTDRVVEVQRWMDRVVEV